MQNKASTPLQSQVKWLSKKDIAGNSTVNWQKAYYLPSLCTRETKLRVFQFKFLHRRIATNDFLCRVRHKTSGLLFFLWGNYWNFGPPVLELKTYPSLLEKNYSNGCLKKNVNLEDSVFSSFLCLGLVENVSNALLHHLLFFARHYIYTCILKYSIPKLQVVYLQLLLTSMKIEKRVALENNTLNSFKRVVEPVEGRPPILK